MKKKTFWIDNPLYQIFTCIPCLIVIIVLFYSFFYFLIGGISGEYKLTWVLIMCLFSLIMIPPCTCFLIKLEIMVVHMDSTHIWMNKELGGKKHLKQYHSEMNYSRIKNIYIILSDLTSKQEVLQTFNGYSYQLYLALVRDDGIEQWMTITAYTRKGQKKIIAELIRRIQMNDNCYIGKTADEIMNDFYSKEDKNNKKSKK